MVHPREPGGSTDVPLPTLPRRRVRRAIVAAPAPSAEQELAARATELQRARSGCVPARWLLPGYARDVDLVRHQLGPLRDRAMLVASFERESARIATLRRLVADPSAPPLPLNPLEAAYAVRWLELSDGGIPLPPWPELVGTRTDSAG